MTTSFDQWLDLPILTWSQIKRRRPAWQNPNCGQFAEEVAKRVADRCVELPWDTADQTKFFLLVPGTAIWYLPGETGWTGAGASNDLIESKSARATWLLRHSSQVSLAPE